MSIIYDYCRGISATQSSAEFLNPVGIEFKEPVPKKISRQTISSYFAQLSERVLYARVTYPWWSVDAWYEITDAQLEKVRKAIYNDDNILKEIRSDFVEETGKSKSVAIDTYMKILQKMSVEMNGLPKKNFMMHYARACEMAYYIENFNDSTNAMFLDILYLFEEEGAVIFSRKKSPTTRAEQVEYNRKRQETKDERLDSWRDFKEDDRDAAEREWWNNLDEDEREKTLKKASLTVFDGDIELPHKRSVRRVK